MKLINNFFFIFLFGFTCLFGAGQARAQNVNFTQYQLAPAQTNPAMIATSNQVNIGLNYRNQYIASGVSYESPMFTVTMPWLRKGIERRGAVGLTFMQDRTGTGGIFTNTGVILTAAYNIWLGDGETNKRHLSIGAQGAYMQQRMDVNALQSGSQWNGSIFDNNIPVNETVDINQKSRGNFNMGAMYYVSDTCDNVRSYVGITLQNINRPNLAFVIGDKFKAPVHFTAVGGISVLNNDAKFQVIPNARYIRNGKAQEIRIGVSNYYKMQGEEARKLGVSTWYDNNGAVSFALELQQPKYSIGMSYDMAAAKPTSSLGAAAWELSIGFKIGKKCLVPREEKIKDEIIMDTTIVEVKGIEGDSIFTLIAQINKNTKEVVKVDTLKKEFKENDIAHTPTEEDLQLFKRLGYFYYRDDEINASTTNLLKEIITVMKKFKVIEIEIEGHSCNIGTEEENQTLSENRCKRVQKSLVDGGIDIKRIKIKGYGATRPVMSNKMEYGRIKNRRVEFKVLQP